MRQYEWEGPALVSLKNSEWLDGEMEIYIDFHLLGNMNQGFNNR